jgi:hypothetical protein
MTESELLTTLLEKPDFYVGHGSVKKIHAFLNGYREAVNIGPDPVYREFGKWLRDKLRISQDRTWLSVICFFGEGEADTLDLAKEMWAKYTREVYGTEILEHHEINEISLTPLGSLRPSELMDYIFDRPAMYLGYTSVPLMQAYMDGFIRARRSEKSELDDPLYAGFHDWVVNRFSFGHSHDWGSIISFIGVSEARSFELAKDLWEEYKRR